jgi:LDH2 family malate/lactate/ureidoglycolate dehydrogenase
MTRRNWWRGTASAGSRLSVAEATERTAHVLIHYGVDRDDALVTAAHLVEGSVRGYPSHGIERVPQLVEMLRSGTLRPEARPRVERTRPGVLVIDAGHGLGPPAAALACALAREAAAECGVGLAALRDAGHLGTLAPWAERCAGTDAFALVSSSSEPGVVAPGGHVPVFGTNPIAYAWPSPSGGGSADFSTAAITRSDLLRAAENGDPLPPMAAVDGNGEPTRRAEAALAGGLLPVGGGTKGGLLSLLAALLAGPVAGGPASQDVRGTRRDEPPHRADLFLVVDLSATTDLGTFGPAVDAMLAAAGAGSAFHPPGSASRRRREAALRDGIPVSAVTADLLCAANETEER